MKAKLLTAENKASERARECLQRLKMYGSSADAKVVADYIAKLEAVVDAARKVPRYHLDECSAFGSCTCHAVPLRDALAALDEEGA